MIVQEALAVSAFGLTPGLRLVEGGGIFVARARAARAVYFCQFDADGTHEIARWRLNDRHDEYFAGFIPGLVVGDRYGLRADGSYDPVRGLFFDPQKLLVDPYAVEIDRPFQYSDMLCAARGAGGDTAKLTPKAIARTPASMVKSGATRAPSLIYELPVKAYSKRDARVPEILRGRLGALTQDHTVERLARLGVSHVQMMPIAAWIDERHLAALGLTNGWGYNPVCFGALDPRLAPGGWSDLRAVSEKLARENIGVLIDVVFNHSGESDDRGPVVSLRGLDDALYYRRMKDGRRANDSGCGNVLNAQAPAVIELALESLRRYVLWGGAAGFRFDLAVALGRSNHGFDAAAPLLTHIALDPVLRDKILIVEPWDIGVGGYRLGEFPYPYTSWNDRYRDDVRRYWRGDSGALGALATRLAGSSDIFSPDKKRPSAGVNFIAAHDGFTLRDLVSYRAKNNWRNGERNRDGADNEICWDRRGDWREETRALMATLFLSLGAPMLTAGDEFGRTQEGNNNAYAQDNAMTWLDWQGADRECENFTAGLAELRAEIEIFAQDRFFTGRADEDGARDVMWLDSGGVELTPEGWRTGEVLMALLTGAGRGLTRKRHCLLFNRLEIAQFFCLPGNHEGACWELALNSATNWCAPGRRVVGAFEAPGRSVCALREVFTDAPQA